MKSEESNTRLANKIHESLLDLSYHPKIGEDLVAEKIFRIIERHHKNPKSSSPKGLMAQLALLFKMINSFGLCGVGNGGSTGVVLTVSDILGLIIPAISHPTPDVKNAAIKILLDL